MTSPNTGTGSTGNSKMPSTTTVSTASIAVTAALVWLIQTYVLHGQLPGPVTVAIYGVVPAIVGGFFTRHALNQMPPNLDKAIAARWDKKFHAAQGTKVVANTTDVNLPSLYSSPLGYSQGAVPVTPVQTYKVGPDGFMTTQYEEPPLTAENPTGKDDNPYKPGDGGAA